jgi:cytochrome c553/cytochrome c2
MKIAAFFVAYIFTALPHALYAQRVTQGERQAPPVVQACVGCHGNRGEGNPAAGSPRIAGQSAYYLLKQLDSYANGSRRDRVMEPIARGLPPELRADVAAYYARIEAPFDDRARTARPPERGRVLAMHGDDGLGVQACRNCHGPGGVGEPPNIPYIAGLDAEYHAAELTAWKEGTRTNDAGQQMFRVAAALSAEDIGAVAQYYASLTPPKPAPPNLVQAPPPQKMLAPGTTPVARSEDQRQESAGAEQGAPMKGGTEGKGGTDVLKDTPAGGKGASERKGSGDASKAPPTSGGTQWPRLSDAAKGESLPGASTTTSVLDGDPARGRAIIATGVHGCAACHTIPGIRAPNGIVGPPLGGLAGRGFIAGELPNRPDVLVAFLQNPPALVPQTGMPNVGLTREQARHIAAYLYTLEVSGAR